MRNAPKSKRLPWNSPVKIANEGILKGVEFAASKYAKGSLIDLGCGEKPYEDLIMPYIYSSYSLTTKPDGLGGSRTIRGIMRNRITGDGVAFGNVELRWKFFKSVGVLKPSVGSLISLADTGFTR